MNKAVFAVGLYVLGIFASSLSQILLKKSADRPHKSWLAEYLNPLVITAYAIFFFATLTTVNALRYISVSLSAVVESVSYIFIAVLSVVFLKERMHKRGILGIVCIAAGVLLFSI